MEDKTKLHEESGAPAGGDNGTGATDEKKTLSFDDWLASNPEYQKEFDRRTSKGIDKAVSKERDRLNALHNDQLNEAERLARMNEDEKREYLDQKKQAELDKRERDITKRELTAEAKNTLIEKGLPVTFAALLDYSSADTVKSGIEALAKEWAPAIENTVNDRLKGGKPPKDAGTEGSGNQTKIDEVRRLMKKG